MLSIVNHSIIVSVFSDTINSNATSTEGQSSAGYQAYQGDTQPMGDAHL
jgi:hypothetical protein